VTFLNSEVALPANPLFHEGQVKAERKRHCCQSSGSAIVRNM